jgi:hypothetical protein
MHIHIHVQLHKRTHTHTLTHTYTYTYMHTHTHTHTYSYTHTHTHIRIHKHTYTYTHTHTCTYTHTHTNDQGNAPTTHHLSMLSTALIRSSRMHEAFMPLRTLLGHVPASKQRGKVVIWPEYGVFSDRDARTAMETMAVDGM